MKGLSVNFFSIWVFFHEHSRFTAGERGCYFFNSSLLLAPASQTLTHQPGDYCTEVTSAHSQLPDSNRKLLVSEHKSLTIKLRALLQTLRMARYLSNGSKFKNQLFADLFKTGVFKNFAIFTEKHLSWSLFLVKLQAFRLVTLLKVH